MDGSIPQHYLSSGTPSPSSRLPSLNSDTCRRVGAKLHPSPDRPQEMDRSRNGIPMLNTRLVFFCHLGSAYSRPEGNNMGLFGEFFFLLHYHRPSVRWVGLTTFILHHWITRRAAPTANTLSFPIDDFASDLNLASPWTTAPRNAQNMTLSKSTVAL